MVQPRKINGRARAVRKKRQDQIQSMKNMSEKLTDMVYTTIELSNQYDYLVQRVTKLELQRQEREAARKKAQCRYQRRKSLRNPVNYHRAAVKKMKHRVSNPDHKGNIERLHLLVHRLR